jgi:hypothetical protein
MHASKADLTAQTLGEYEGRMADSGEWRIAFESMPAQFPPDDSPFRGLPDGRCQCPHLGYVISGSFRVTHRDGREEVVRAGEAYHLEPGHFVQTLEPAELVEFSPRAQHDETMAVVKRNIGLEV